ncbi:MAG: pyruvate, phosphate dikinase [Ilumatobacter sp.]|nr:pyruvate, phosphate dikinase [Ilumatobacter sp.]
MADDLTAGDALESAVAAAVDAGDAPADREAALMSLSAADLEAVIHARLESAGTVLTSGLAASPGAATGTVYFTADDAADAADRGEAVILVRTETTPADVHGMMVATGLLTTRGDLVSHAALVARGWGTPAVVGAGEITISGTTFAVGDTVVAEGDTISIDGSTGEVMLGAQGGAALPPPAAFFTVLGWADDVRRGHLAVRANADTAADAEKARMLGAEGIGLCRTEHMFLAPDRLPVMRAMILARTAQDEAVALDELGRVQRTDFAEILTVMDGLPVTVRLLDPPLHEFLPSVLDLEVKRAGPGLDDEEQRQLDAALDWAEHNPMIGTRGVRLAVIKPGLYAMQVRALLAAVHDRRDAGRHPLVEIMIPLTVSRAELALARSWVDEAAAAAGLDADARADISVGTMIETPRAALRAGELAEEADFFSFGTNDLTQLTYGFSRDDVGRRVIPAYLAHGVLPSNPFVTIDADAVGELVREATARGRAAKPGLRIGVCGEHGGDPASIELFHDAGLDYVSCSPFRVPIARLAAAQAVIAARRAR